MMRTLHAGGLQSQLHRGLTRILDRQHAAAARELVMGILARMPSFEGCPPPETWSIQRERWTDTGLAVITVGPASQSPRAVVKLARTGAGAESLRRQATALAALRTEPRLENWNALVPRPLAHGELGGHAYLVEHALPGRDGRAALTDPSARVRLQLTAATAVGELHRCTANSVVVDVPTLDRWVDQPLCLLRVVARRRAAVGRLRSELHEALAGRSLTVNWIHGDFWPGNVLLAPGGTALTGIVDWEWAAPGELSFHDVLHLLLYTRTLMARCHLGDTVRAFLAGARWTPDEAAVLDRARPSPADDFIPMRVMLLLYWLRYVTANLLQSATYGRNVGWVSRNVDGVLRCC